MKKRIYALLAGLFLFCAQSNANHLIVVSPKGSDKALGTVERPFLTVERALSEAKKYAGDTVDIRLRGGVYRLSETVRVTGFENLTIAPYRQEKVSFEGGISIAPKWLRPVGNRDLLERMRPEVRERVREIDVQALGVSLSGIVPKGFGRVAMPAWSELFIDGVPQQVARWPNDSTVLIGKVHCTGDIPRNHQTGIGDPVFEYLEERPSEWHNVENAWIAGYFGYGYADDMIPLKAVDASKKTITGGIPTLYGFRSGEPFLRWYALNLLEEIDMPGEYVIDAQAGKLYLLPPEGKFKELRISLLGTPMFSISECRNVTLRGVTLEYARGMGVYIERSEHTRVDSCVIRNLGYVGVCIGRGDLPQNADIYYASHDGSRKHPDGVPEVIGNLSNRLYDDRLFDRQAGRNNGVSNSLIYQVGSGGVSLGGGQRKTLTPAGNYVENCRIYDFNRVERSYRPGIGVDGVGNRISHCEIFDAPSMAILMNGNDHLIEYCDIHHVCQEVDDQGAIYYGRDPSERGMKVRYCYLHHLASAHRVSATYHDDGACGMEVYGCLYYKAGTIPVLIGGGHDNVYRNNIFVDVPFTFHIDNRMEGWGRSMLDKGGIAEQRLNLVGYDRPPYATAYPLLPHYWENHPRVPRNNIISGNLFYKVGSLLRGKLAWGEWSNNYITSLNPGFKDPEDPIQGFRPDAAVYERINGFHPIPFAEIGCHLSLE